MKDAWDTLARLYQIQNESFIAFLGQHLTMDEDASMDQFLTKVKDLREQLATVDEILLHTS